MPAFEVLYHPKFRRALKKVQRSGRADIVELVVRAIDVLAENPITPRPGADILPLVGYPMHSFRLRLGEYRVLYNVELETRTVTLVDIFHRGRDYRP